MSPSIEFVSTQQSGQVQQTEQQLAGSPGATVHAGFRRHTEFDAGDHAGQDWCGVRVVGTTGVAVVADGVSQSFMGDIAARVIGRGLLDAISLEGEAALLAPRCQALLEELRVAAQREAEAFALSGGVPEFLRAALESKRNTSGTQAVVAAAVVDLATGRGRLLLVGDIAVTVHRRHGPPAVVAGDRRARWSSLHGLRGAAVNEQIEGVTGVVLASDGLPADFGRDRDAFRDRSQLDRAISAGAERDDASFVALFAEGLPTSARAGLPAASPRVTTVLGAPPQAPPPAASPPSPGGPSPASRPPYAPLPPTPTPSAAPPPAPRRWRTILVFVIVATGLATAADHIAAGLLDPRDAKQTISRQVASRGPRASKPANRTTPRSPPTHPPNGNSLNGNSPNGNSPNRNSPNRNSPNRNSPNDNSLNGNSLNGNSPNAGHAPTPGTPLDASAPADVPQDHPRESSTRESHKRSAPGRRGPTTAAQPLKPLTPCTCHGIPSQTG